MNIGQFDFHDNKVVIRIKNRVCETSEELLDSKLFKEVVKRCVQQLTKRGSRLMEIFGKAEADKKDIQTLIQTLQYLVKMPAKLVPNIVPGSEVFFRDAALFNDFVEHLYNFWRSFDRFMICDSTGNDLDQRPYRTFNAVTENLTHLVRGTYRDIEENITGRALRMYRQIRAGAEIATISLPIELPLSGGLYEKLKGVQVIRQMLLYPPLILNPPSNTRSGKFERVSKNPLESVELKSEEWICYPAKVGPLIMWVYIHMRFLDLGFSLCNLFELADDEDLKRRPDAIYLFGVSGDALQEFGPNPSVFFEDDAAGTLVAAVPCSDHFAYFGYLKKMLLTLHNIRMMKQGRMPFHGALMKITLKGGRSATMLMIGDTGAGKSETLEAFRVLAAEEIQDILIIADDMGSLDIGPQGEVIGYGTEIGAFLRLDDLQPGYAFGSGGGGTPGPKAAGTR